MRGQDNQQADMFSYLSPEQRVRPDHPLRAIRAMADLALWSMSSRFDEMYSQMGRPSIPPEKLLRAQLLQMLYSVRSERLLVEAWASLKSFQRKDGKNPPPDDPGNPTVDFHGEKRSNQTHASTTDADALLARKGNGKEAKLSYNGNLLVENRNGLILTTELFQANGTAERDAALVMLERLPGDQRVTVGANKASDTKDFVAECRNIKVTPHVAQNVKRSGGSAIDERTTRHAGYAISQKKRKRIEESFGWLKTIALMRKVRHRGIHKVGWVFTFAAAAYNLVRMRNLLASPVGVA
jgi:transposase